MSKPVLLLTGGVGGAKLALGLYKVLPADKLIIAVNTGDDFDHFGLRICPDIDTTLYTLAGISDEERGWGRAGESWQCLDTLAELGGENWFRLGDRDLALHLLRNQALQQGISLSAFTARTASQLGIRARVIPAADQSVATTLETTEGRLAFQEYFVKRQCKPAVHSINYTGAHQAKPNDDIIKLLESGSLRAVIIAPSNPFLSIEPILSIKGMRSLLERTKTPVVAVSPIIDGRAVKGPAAKIMNELGLASSALAVREYYGKLLDGFVLDNCDRHLLSEMNVATLCTQTLMRTMEDRTQLASATLDFCDNIGSSRILETQ